MSRRRRTPFEWTSHGDLERYGLLALVAAFILGVAYLAQALAGNEPVANAQEILAQIPEQVPAERSDDAQAPDAASDVEAIQPPAPRVETHGVALLDRRQDAPGGGVARQPARRAHFDFFEPPVRLPGRMAVIAPPTPGAVADARSTVIQKGDTLQKIAARELGSSEQWRVLIAWNPGLDPKRLKTGAKLQLPPVVRAAPKVTATPAARRHVVMADETLRSIAKRWYGDEERWIDLLEANRDVLDGPGRVRVGLELRIP